MKVYTHLVIDMATDEVLEEQSYNYEGPVAQCFGGGGSGGGGGSSVPEVQTSIIREAPGVEERKLGLMDLSRALAEKPITIPTQQIAPFTGLEQQGLTQAGITGVGQPSLTRGITDIRTGIGSLGTSAQLTSAGVGSAFALPRTSAFLNPFQQFITDEINRQAEISKNQLAANAVAYGGFGGGREGVAIGEIERARLGKIGELGFETYGTALQAAQRQQALEAQTGLQAGQQMAQLGQTFGQLGGLQAQVGAQEQAMAQSDINQLMAAGGLQRQLAQQALDAQRAQQLQQAYEPFQRAEFLKAQYQGGPTTQSGITTATTPQTNPLAQIAGAGLGAYAAYQTATAPRTINYVGNPPRA